MYLLAANVGNTHTALGLFQGERLGAVLRFRTGAPDTRRTPDEWDALLYAALGARGIAYADIHAVAIASVVPAVGTILAALSRERMDVEPLVVVGGDTDLGLTLRQEPPHSIGADRLVNAFAAHALYRAPCLVFDFGTATTLDAVTADGDYRGGVILPGVGIAMDALFERTALLRRPDLTAIPPPPAIATSTDDALRAGILYGAAAQAEGLAARLRAEMPPSEIPLRILATGGLAALIAPHTSCIEVVVPDLTLIGLRRIHERHADMPLSPRNNP